MRVAINMDAFEAYQRYLALKNHFTQKKYDYFKYNGRVSASKLSFDKRKDRYSFHRLSKHRDPINLMVSNFLKDGNAWVQDIAKTDEAERVYKEWLKTQESLFYVFSQDLETLGDDWNQAFRVVDGQHPPALKALIREEIKMETLIIINDLTGVFKHWNKAIEEEFIWPDIYFRCRKYKPFLKYDALKYKEKIVAFFQR